MDGDKNGLPCISCSSSDAMTIYADNTGYCFSCNTFFHADQLGHKKKGGKETEFLVNKINFNSIKIISADVPVRGLDKASLEYFGVGVSHDETSGELSKLIFPVYRNGNLSGYKEKNLNTKSYVSLGITKQADMFGQNKAPSGGKLLIITEGEEDAMAAHQMLKQQGKSYNVVSLPTGANPSSVRNNIEWIEKFETIILNLDNDKKGKETAVEIAELLTPGKVKIMHFPYKDSNDFLLKKKDSKAYLSAIYNSKPYSPAGIINLGDTWDAMWEDNNQASILYPWKGLNDLTYGAREREIVTIAAGTGVGKSALIREIEYHIWNNTKDKIGILALEESLARTAWGFVALDANLPLAIKEKRDKIPVEEIRKIYDRIHGSRRIEAFDHWGGTSEQDLLNRIRGMIRGLNCKWIILDHLHIIVSALNDGGDERKTIDSIMTNLRKMVEETNAGLFLVSHLRRIDGNKGHEQGVEVSLSHLRGSQAIAQLSDIVVSAERDQQADEEKIANLTTIRVLKNRYAGLTGLATYLSYDRETGRMNEVTNIDDYLFEVDHG